MNVKRLQLEQLDQKLKPFRVPEQSIPPPRGWIKTIRSSMGMTLRQLGSRMGMSEQGVKKLESREEDGSITLKALMKFASAVDMTLTYGFHPKTNTVDEIVRIQARKVAAKIVYRTSVSMALENQANSEARLKKAIDEQAAEIYSSMPRYLWD